MMPPDGLYTMPCLMLLAITTENNPEEDQFLVEYASGKSAEIYPDNSGVLLPG